MAKIAKLFLVSLSILALGCGDSSINAPAPVQSVDVNQLNLSTADNPVPEQGVFEVCKIGSAADFDVTIIVDTGDGNPQTIDKTVHVEDGACVVVHTEDGGPADLVTITEIVPAGYQLDGVEIFNIDEAGTITSHSATGPTISGQIEAQKLGCVAVYHNSPLSPTPGRMTGGGHQVRIDGVRITRGLTLHCDITLSNNLEINWPGGNKWHITKPLLSAECIDDPNFNPTPPAAPFDTFIGEAMGELNGAAGSICRFKFIDDGEPGRTDEAYIKIWMPGADPDSDAPYLEVGGQLDGGNLQAHYDQPHS